MSRGVPLAECRECHDPIRFVALNTGKSVPVNPQPSDRGTVAARRVATTRGPALHGRIIHADDPPTETEETYVVHFATCEERKRKTPTTAPVEPEPSLF